MLESRRTGRRGDSFSFWTNLVSSWNLPLCIQIDRTCSYCNVWPKLLVGAALSHSYSFVSYIKVSMPMLIILIKLHNVNGKKSLEDSRKSFSTNRLNNYRN